jgi:hypothetical protein
MIFYEFINIKVAHKPFSVSQLGRLKMMPSVYYCISYFFEKLYTFCSHMALTIIYERNPHRIHETGLE